MRFVAFRTSTRSSCSLVPVFSCNKFICLDDSKFRKIHISVSQQFNVNGEEETRSNPEPTKTI